MLPFAFLLLALGVLAMRRPMSGLEYNNLRRENRGNILRGRGGPPLHPPVPLSFSLNILKKLKNITLRYYRLILVIRGREYVLQSNCTITNK